jgi:hypothetical protein
MTGFGRSYKAMVLPSTLCKLSSVGQARSAEDCYEAPGCNSACGPVPHHKFPVRARPPPWSPKEVTALASLDDVEGNFV